MFQLIATVKRGTASSLPFAWCSYATLDAARVAATAMLREERVQRVMVVSDDRPAGFVEWRER